MLEEKCYLLKAGRFFYFKLNTMTTNARDFFRSQWMKSIVLRCPFRATRTEEIPSVLRNPCERFLCEGKGLRRTYSIGEGREVELQMFKTYTNVR